jgi:hypothetical protein
VPKCHTGYDRSYDEAPLGKTLCRPDHDRTGAHSANPDPDKDAYPVRSNGHTRDSPHIPPSRQATRMFRLVCGWQP